MNLTALDLFVAVARKGSFAAVAKDQRVDPSSVSRAIADLEAELGLRLFQRTTRRLTLTEAGAVYLARIEPVAEDLAHAREAALQVTGAPRGLLRLTASATFGQACITPLLGEFCALYPQVALECLFTDANIDMVADRIDLAVRLAPTVEGDLIAAKLMNTHYRVVASPAYLDAHPPIFVPADLSAHRVIRFTLKSFRHHWRFRDREGRVERVAVDGDLTLAPAGALLAAAIDGLGPALLPHWLAGGELARGELVDLFPDLHAAADGSFETAAWLIYPSRAFLPGKVRAMADFLRARLAHGGKE